MYAAFAFCPDCNSVMRIAVRDTSIHCTCSKCNAMHFITDCYKTISAKIAIKHQDRFLAYFKPNCAEARLPGGKAEKSDGSLANALTRELSEELSCDVLIWDFSKVDGYRFFDYERNVGWHDTCLLCVDMKDCSLIPKDVPNEGGSVDWLEPCDIHWSSITKRHIDMIVHGAR